MYMSSRQGWNFKGRGATPLFFLFAEPPLFATRAKPLCLLTKKGGILWVLRPCCMLLYITQHRLKSGSISKCHYFFIILCSCSWERDITQNRLKSGAIWGARYRVKDFSIQVFQTDRHGNRCEIDVVLEISFL